MKRKQPPTNEAINTMKERLLADLATVRSALERDAALRAEQALASVAAVDVPDKIKELTQGVHDEAKALASLETFMAVSLQVMKGTRASQVAEALRVVEIRARMDGKHVFE